MANVAIFKSGQVPRYLLSVNTPDYDQDPDVLVNPDVSAVASVPLKYWKRVGDLIEEMTQAEKDAVDAAEQSASLAVERQAASDKKDDPTAEGIEWRAVVLLLLDEINNLRQWDASFKAAVAAASNLADLKTRVAALPDMPDRTIAQAKNAYLNSISTGRAD